METLQQGARGPLVEFAQTLLNGEYYATDLGGEELNQDGIFGPRTAAQLSRFISNVMAVSMPTLVNDAVWRALGVDQWREHATTLVAQHGNMLCWNAAAAMTRGVVASMVTGGATLGATGGLQVNAANVNQFLRAVGLTPITVPANGAALAPMLTGGRMWLAGAVTGGGLAGATHHAVCLSGIITTAPRPGREQRTLVRIHDPWPPSPTGAGGGTIRWQHFYMPRMYLGAYQLAPMFAAR